MIGLMRRTAMKITNFEATGLDRLEAWLIRNSGNAKTALMLKQVLPTVNISFVLEEINRVHSMLICELKDSYVQQSQRYVMLTNDAYILPALDYSDEQQARNLTERAFSLYAAMSQLKAGDFKGRPKPEHYLHGIPIEDARYILPISAKTNVCITMSGDKLVNLFGLLNDKKYGDLLAAIRTELLQNLPPNLGKLLDHAIDSRDCSELVQDFYADYFSQITADDNLVLLERFGNLDMKVGFGAMTSTLKDTPSQAMARWGQDAPAKARGVVERVLGYGHDSIAEQARTTFGMLCSLVTYHQQLRHRLSQNYREELYALVQDKAREPKVPATVKQSRFYQAFCELVDEFKAFREFVAGKYGQDKALPFLLNCDQIKLIMSANARADISMLSDRTCTNAQWEIRELAIKKLKVLRSLSPVLYEKALPSCVLGKCKEGKLSCGQQLAVKEQFLHL
jgi:thymidylate synthase ThyX